MLLSPRAQASGIRAVKLPVSHAFHTPLVAAAAPVLAQQLAQEEFNSPRHRILSTITGVALGAQDDLRALLRLQVTSPVKFIEAVTAAADAVDLLIEVGPGQVLAGLAADCVAAPAIALDCGGPSLKGLLQAVGAAFALGAPLNHTALFRGRFTRPFALDWKPKFFTNPCELAPAAESRSRRREASDALDEMPPAPISHPPISSPLDLLRQLVADRAELPLTAVHPESRMLGDLHLNSITVAQLVAEAARRLELAPIVGLTDFANASVGQIL